jgi:hypothetical protein
MANTRKINTPINTRTGSNALLVELQHVVLEYLDDSSSPGGSFETKRNCGLFDNIVHSRATTAAKHILAGNPDAALSIIKKDPEMLLSHTVTVKDRVGREFSGTLLQIAARANDFNIHASIPDEEKDHGGIENLRAYLPHEELLKQLAVVFPPDWEKEMAARTQAILNIVDLFSEKLISLSEGELTEISALKAELKPVPFIKEFQNTLLREAQKIGKTGYIFDPQIFCAVARLFAEKVARFGGWQSEKSNLFWVHVYGLLQKIAAASDFQVIKKGICYVIKGKETVERDFNFSTDRSAELAGLGFSYFYDNFGMLATEALAVVGSEDNIAGILGQQFTCKNFLLLYQSLYQLKKRALFDILSSQNDPEYTQTLGAAAR